MGYATTSEARDLTGEQSGRSQELDRQRDQRGADQDALCVFPGRVAVGQRRTEQEHGVFDRDGGRKSSGALPGRSGVNCARSGHCVRGLTESEPVAGMVRHGDQNGGLMTRTLCTGMILAATLGGAAGASPVSLLSDDVFRTESAAFIPMERDADPNRSATRAILQPVARDESDDDRPGGPSLFAMLDGRGLWQPDPRAGLGLGQGADFAGTLAARASRLRGVIAKAEAGRAGFDAVQHGAKTPPPDRPTRMTIAEIYAWIDATPRQPHAIGRYQFIPSTLRALVEALEIDPAARFSPTVQDRLADRLLAQAGMHAFATGALSRDRFMLNLARIWAGLPTASGASYYEGYAGNSATMSWQAFESAMADIFPAGPHPLDDR